LSILTRILNVQAGKVIITTKKACVGIDFIFDAPRAFVISTEEMLYLDELFQPLGRSSRKD
jgi:hypothetical protein